MRKAARTLFATRVSASRMLVLGLMLVPWSVTAVQAQFREFWGGSGPFMNRADFVQADAAARLLLEPRPGPVGASQQWANPASGTSGALTITRAYLREGEDCRTISWHDIYKAGEDRTVMIDACRIKGEWKLM